MKTFFWSLAVISILQCSTFVPFLKAQDCITDPLPSFVSNFIAAGCTDLCSEYALYQGYYNSQTVFYAVAVQINCSDAISLSVADCLGNSICTEGGFSGGTGNCPNFLNTVTNSILLCGDPGSGTGGGCNPPTPAVVLPTNTICTVGEVLPPIITATVTPIALPLIYALGLFVVDEAGNIVMPISSGNFSLDFTGLPSGTYYVQAIVYAFDNPPNLASTTINQLTSSGGCYKLSDITPENTLEIGSQIPHAFVTTAPNCNGDGTYNVGITVMGSSGSAYLNSSTTLLQEGIETFVTFNNPYYDLHVSDALTGCAEDFIELLGPVDCSTCIDSTHYDPNAGCIEIFAPVCGCNGQTYDNWCYAYYGGVTSWVNGTCGNEYYFDYNVCQGDTISIGMAGWEGNVMYDWSPMNGVVGCVDNCGTDCSNCFNISVSPSSTTTYTLHTFYTLGMEHSYYHYTLNVNDCSSDCIDSALIDSTSACPDIWMPVCGCNFVTYGNQCDATNYGGVTTSYPGECGEQQSLVMCAGDSIQIGIPWMFEYFFEWQTTQNLTCADGSCNYAWVKPDTSTRYVLRVYSPIGGTGTVYFFDIDVQICEAIPDPAGHNSAELTLFPNPANEQVVVQYSNSQDRIQSLSLYNSIGQQAMFLNEPATTNGQLKLDLSQLTPGLYYLKLQTDKGQSMVKPIVKSAK